MSGAIEITSITGTQPYDLYVCDIYDNGCEFVQSFDDSTPLPLIVSIPDNFMNVPIIKIKIVDGDNCETSYNQVCNSFP